MNTPQPVNAANPMFAKFDAALGKTTPTIAGAAPVQSRAAEIRALGSTKAANPAPLPDPAYHAPEDKPTGFIADTARNTVEAAKGGIADMGKGIDEGAQALQDKEAGGDNSLGSELKTGYDVANAGLKTGEAGVGTLFSPIAGLVKTLSDRASDNPHVQEFAKSISPLLDAANTGVSSLDELAQKHPEVSKGVNNLIGVLGLEGGKEGIGKAVENGGELAGKAAEAGGEIAGKAGDMVKGAADTVIEAGKKAKDSVGDLATKAQLGVTKGNEIPTLENAASRKLIPIPGDTQVKDPLSSYDEHVATEQKALKDAKADTALGTVGSRIGDAFEQVAKQRSEAGAKMSSELEKIGAHGADTLSAADALRTELAKNGLSYDQVTKEISRGKASKVTESDRAQLEDYAKNLQALGSKPTLQELDAFLSRTPDELNVYKAKNNITGTTNGERIIKNNLTQLRKELDPQIDAKTGKAAKPYLKDYAAARKQYADLSKFLDEGVPFLGKKTSSGDYAKDASIAKSAVQSVLNNGKKDWLLKLEQLSGYPAIDDATLALQAMKDVGDYRGASLLETITNGAAKGELPHVPTTGTGILNAMIGRAVKKGTQKFTGTPIEQTRRFLQSLKDAKK